MKKFKAVLTVVLDIEAETQEEAQNVIQDMDYEFIDPRQEDRDLSNEILDFEVSEVEEE